MQSPGPFTLIALALLAIGASIASMSSHWQDTRASAERLPPPPPPAGWHMAADTLGDYRMVRSVEARHEGYFGAEITRVSGNALGYGLLMQVVDAKPYRGKRVRLVGWMKTQAAESGQLWLRIDAVDRMQAIDNMADRAMHGTRDWALCEIVMDVPATAHQLAFGALLWGHGRVLIDEMSLGIAPPNARLTRFRGETKHTPMSDYHSSEIAQVAPVNLDFEE